MRYLAVVLTVLLPVVGGCASSSTPKREYFTLRTGNGGTQMALGQSGEIIGPTLQLSPTDSGYRGLADAAIVDLRSDGERITGTIRDRIIDLHISLEDEGLVARGLFGGRLGRLDASNNAIRSTLGVCTYELEAKGSRYEGQRACGRSNMPMVRPTSIELPVGFERLKVDRQVMLLAILLSL
jgi:hypothetical protein